jgi:hypothetical protein
MGLFKEIRILKLEPSGEKKEIFTGLPHNVCQYIFNKYNLTISPSAIAKNIMYKTLYQKQFYFEYTGQKLSNDKYLKPQTIKTKNTFERSTEETEALKKQKYERMRQLYKPKENIIQILHHYTAKRNKEMPSDPELKKVFIQKWQIKSLADGTLLEWNPKTGMYKLK